MTFHLPNGWSVDTHRWKPLPIIWYARVIHGSVLAAVFWGLGRTAVFERAYNAAWRQADD